MDSRPDSVDGFLHLNDPLVAVDALETLADCLEAVAAGSPVKWKWAIITLHHTVQGFMVLALKSTWRSARVTHKDYRRAMVKAEHEYRLAVENGEDTRAQLILAKMITSSGGLASHRYLYARIKDHDAMRQSRDSRHFTPRSVSDGSFDDDGRMERLNEVRGHLMHPPEDSLVYDVIEFERITEAGLHIVDFLLSQSNNIAWHPTVDGDLEARAREALVRSNLALTRISAQRAP